MPTYEDSGQRLRNARVRLDQILDSLPPDVTHHVANMIHNIADAILRTERAGEGRPGLLGVGGAVMR